MCSIFIFPSGIEGAGERSGERRGEDTGTFLCKGGKFSLGS